MSSKEKERIHQFTLHHLKDVHKDVVKAICDRHIVRSSNLEDEHSPILLVELKDGVLYRRRQEGANTSFQLVLPDVLRAVVFQSLHDDMCHMGIDRTSDLIRSRFYWPKMSTFVEEKIRTCNLCV